jgi:hypothetical protein
MRLSEIAPGAILGGLVALALIAGVHHFAAPKPAPVAPTPIADAPPPAAPASPPASEPEPPIGAAPPAPVPLPPVVVRKRPHVHAKPHAAVTPAPSMPARAAADVLLPFAFVLRFVR